MIKCVIFDLDGTLVNTIDDLGLACDYLLEKQGKELKWTIDDYKNFVGNGAKLLVDRAFEGTLDKDELEELYQQFKVKYDEIKLDHAHAYDGIKKVVSILKENKIKLAVCTNKPDVAAKGMVNDIFGKDLFDIVCGAVDDLPKKPDPTIAKSIIKELKVTPNECVWIGDSSVDIETAKNLGCKSVGVTWGFRSFEHLFKAYPTLILNEPKEILKIFDFS